MSLLQARNKWSGPSLYGFGVSVGNVASKRVLDRRGREPLRDEPTRDPRRRPLARHDLPGALALRLERGAPGAGKGAADAASAEVELDRGVSVPPAGECCRARRSEACV